MERVTVIIPVYNSEEYIGGCLDSILAQTYTNIEIIVVNDGSRDNSQDIINEYQSKYPERIIVIEQENKGVAITRNESIYRATGKYIMFIDNDDFIDKDYIETYISIAEEEKSDVVIGGYRRPNKNGKVIKSLKLKDSEWSKFMIMAPWAKIYSKSYLIKNNIKFLRNNIGEDVYFNLKAMLLSNKIKVIDYIGYNWFFNSKSVSNTTQKNIRNLQVYELLNNCYDMLKNENLLEENYEILKAYFTRYIIWLLSFSTKKMEYKIICEEYDKLFKWLEEKFPDYRKNKMISYTKPYGENCSLKLFMIAHKLSLGKLVTYLYSRL